MSVTVTAEDGITTKCYMITCLPASTAPDNANLADLSVSEGSLSPAFDPETPGYTVNVADTVSSITVTGAPANENAKVVYSPSQTVDSLRGGIPLSIIVTVTAEDTITTRRYTVRVIRALAGGKLPITSAGEMAEIGSSAAYPLDGEYQLMQDITLTDDWTPIGSGSTPFTGKFDGNNHTIIMRGSMLAAPTTVSSSGWSGATVYVMGLFGIVQNAEIKNLNAIWLGNPLSPSLNTNEYLSAGIVAGWSENTDFQGVTIMTGSTEFSVTASQFIAAGALAGTLTGGGIFQCGSFVNVRATAQTFGESYAGGLVGNVEDTQTEIKECFVFGNVSAADCGYAGGLAGHNGGQISDSYTTGTVSLNYSQSGTNEVKAGGLAGKNQHSIVKSYARGTVSVTILDAASVDTVYIGGISGISTDNASVNSTISGCAALNEGLPLSLSDSGSATSREIHRIALNSSADFTSNIANSGMTGDSFSDKTASGKDGANTGVPAPRSAFETTLGWNFVTIWKMSEDYPVLQWQQ
jgi:hypothetical protein